MGEQWHCMIARSMKLEFESVLQEQQLADIAEILSDREFCDEVPLYSRYRQVDFLKQYGDVDLLLMELSLDYLERVTSGTPIESTERFAAITVIGADYLVPSIFLCNSDATRQLKKLSLSRPSTTFGQQIDDLVKRARSDQEYIVLEDQMTVPGAPREFISFRFPPAGFVSLSDFCLPTCQQ